MKPTKPGVVLIVLLFTSTMALAYYASQPIETPPKPPIEVAPPCDLDCMVDQRAEEVFERDQEDYRNQARLKALIEIQDELHAITLEYGQN